MVNIRAERIFAELRRAWTDSAPLTATSLLMLAALMASGAGIFLDARIISGAPAWLKPAKFAISTAIFCGTMAWLFRYITIWRSFVRAMGWVIAAVLIVEVAIIDLQAARGTTSHFNAATTLDLALFGIMGLSIAILWLASIGVLVALFHQKFQDLAWGWWLRVGMLITVIGSAAGGMMLRMTQAPETPRTNQSIVAVGGHTVGGPDGGPGLAGLGWSTRHGDLRIPHFFGLHGIQIVPFLGWLTRRKRRGEPERKEIALAITTGVSYLALIAILAWQALRGQSIVSPDGITLLVLSAWLAGTAAFIVVFRLPHLNARTAAAAR